MQALIKKRIRIRIFGHVQGIFFRQHTKKFADSNNITGFVKNEKDGSVTILAEGYENALTHLLEWCKGDAHGAVIRYIEKNWENVSKGFSSFEIQ